MKSYSPCHNSFAVFAKPKILTDALSVSDFAASHSRRGSGVQMRAANAYEAEVQLQRTPPRRNGKPVMRRRFPGETGATLESSMRAV